MNISSNFFYELFKFCFLPFGDKEIYDVCEKYLEYHYLPKEEYKIIWKAVKNYINVNEGQFPTIGTISQQFNHKKEVLDCLNQIKESAFSPKRDLLNNLEEALKGFYFAEKYDSQAKLYNEGKKDEAFKMAYDTGLYLVNFSLKQETNKFVKIFGGFDERQKEREDSYSTASFIKRKCPFFIDELDDISHGGCDYGDTFLALSQSGVGKSKFLKHIGVNNARIGKRVFHIQAEGTKKECLDLYDATWTGQDLHNIEAGNIDSAIKVKLKKVINDILFNKGEIIVYAAEQFDSLTMKDIRNLTLEVEKAYGFVDEILIDYLELIEPGNGKYYGVKNERERREQVSKEMKNLAVELNKVVGSCTQASDVPTDKLNDPLFVMTRHNVSEYKLIVKPFSYFITFNQTNNEYEKGIMRIYADKIRKYKAKQTITIAQCYEHERFYDRNRTIENFYKRVI